MLVMLMGPQPNVNYLVIILNFKIFFLPSIQMRFLRAHVQILIKLISIGSCFPEVRAFGTLIMSNNMVFRLKFDPPLDNLLPEEF